VEAVARDFLAPKKRRAKLPHVFWEPKIARQKCYAKFASQKKRGKSDA
jgi:hypothetical protein